jgi:putative acetyltransferase
VTVRIRLEEPADRDASLEIERSAFASEEEPAIVEAVRDLEGSFALVAEEEGRVVGHVQFSRAWIGDTRVLSLGPIGVRPDRQGNGIGSALIAAGLRESRERAEPAVILLGSPQLYPRFGFEPGSVFGLRNPFAGVPDEDFMIAPLDDRAGSMSGLVRWHPSFGEPG